MSKPDWCPQDIWEIAEGLWPDAHLSHDRTVQTRIARGIIAERKASADVGQSAVMKFRARVGKRYYAGYHEDMRDFVGAAIRNR